MFGRKIPYEILTFTTSGELISRLEAPFEIADISLALLLLEPEGIRGTSPSLSTSKIQVPSGAASIGPGVIFSQRSSPTEGVRFWDLLDDASGRLVQSERIPDDWLYPHAFSPDLSRVYVLARDAGEPTVEIVRVLKCDAGGWP
jgi:hypothetical protein